VFSAGQYRPDTGDGQRLLAHELAHTIQQGAGGAVMMRVPDPNAKTQVKEDANEKELKEKVGKLISSQYGGDYKKAFDHYAGKDGAVDAFGLKSLLTDAGIGNAFTRGLWVDGILKKLDTNKNGKIEWSEFSAVLKK
jgi:Domain of unknown function (DUF4157)